MAVLTKIRLVGQRCTCHRKQTPRATSLRVLRVSACIGLAHAEARRRGDTYILSVKGRPVAAIRAHPWVILQRGRAGTPALPGQLHIALRYSPAGASTRSARSLHMQAGRLRSQALAKGRPAVRYLSRLNLHKPQMDHQYRSDPYYGITQPPSIAST